MIAIVKFLLSEGMKYVLTERFNQDTVEVFFAQQRSRGGRCDNPSVKQFLRNTQTIMVQKSLALGGSSNISSRKGATLLTLLHLVDQWQSIDVQGL